MRCCIHIGHRCAWLNPAAKPCSKPRTTTCSKALAKPRSKAQTIHLNLDTTDTGAVLQSVPHPQYATWAMPAADPVASDLSAVTGGGKGGGGEGPHTIIRRRCVSGEVSVEPPFHSSLPNCACIVPPPPSPIKYSLLPLCL